MSQNNISIQDKFDDDWFMAGFPFISGLTNLYLISQSKRDHLSRNLYDIVYKEVSKQELADFLKSDMLQTFILKTAEARVKTIRATRDEIDLELKNELLAKKKLLDKYKLMSEAERDSALMTYTKKGLCDLAEKLGVKVSDAWTKSKISQKLHDRIMKHNVTTPECS
jgi:hypothetical protein